MGELVKLPSRESHGDVGSNPVGVSIYSRFFSYRFVFVLLYLKHPHLFVFLTVTDLYLKLSRSAFESPCRHRQF